MPKKTTTQVEDSRSDRVRRERLARIDALHVVLDEQQTLIRMIGSSLAAMADGASHGTIEGLIVVAKQIDERLGTVAEVVEALQ